MKRQPFLPIVALLALILFAPFNAFSVVRAQGGDAKLTPAPKPTPAPKGVKSAKNTPPPAPPAAPPMNRTLTFGEETKGQLDPKTSDKGATGGYFEELTLNAKSDDLLTFKIESESPSLSLQVLDKDKAEVALARDASGGFKVNSQTGGLPADGEYRVRVSGMIAGKNAIPFKLKVDRLGLTPAAYGERFQKIFAGYQGHESDAAAVEEAVTKLEELGKDDATRPTTFEMLGIIYLYNRKDVEKAEQAMSQAIKANGAAVVKITYDNQWRRMVKLKSGEFGFEDSRTGWLRIRPGQLQLTDAGNKTLANLTGPQIKEMSKIVTAANNLVTVTADNPRKPFIFAPASLQQAEADLVIKLIQNYVMGKTN
jgi:hypothetical protein